MTAEELRAELAYWTADGNWYMIWYFTERVKELEENDGQEKAVSNNSL